MIPLEDAKFDYMQFVMIKITYAPTLAYVSTLLI